MSSWLTPVKHAVRRLLPPGWYDHLKLPFVHAYITRQSGGRVLSGPFRGLRYVAMAVGSAYHPKLLGTYEREIAHWFEQLLVGPARSFIDVGAAEGYYAVGMALRAPQWQVIAFELTAEGRALIAQMAASNGVADRISIRGACTPEALEAALMQSPGPHLVLVDVEGYESELLDPARVPSLRHSTIIVELHPWAAPGLEAQLRARFAATHIIDAITDAPRTLAEFPLPAPPLALRYHVLRSMTEHRAYRQTWWRLEPRVSQ